MSDQLDRKEGVLVQKFGFNSVSVHGVKSMLEWVKKCGGNEEDKLST